MNGTCLRSKTGQLCLALSARPLYTTVRGGVTRPADCTNSPNDCYALTPTLTLDWRSPSAFLDVARGLRIESYSRNSNQH